MDRLRVFQRMLCTVASVDFFFSTMICFLILNKLLFGRKVSLIFLPYFVLQALLTIHRTGQPDAAVCIAPELLPIDNSTGLRAFYAVQPFSRSQSCVTYPLVGEGVESHQTCLIALKRSLCLSSTLSFGKAPVLSG